MKTNRTVRFDDEDLREAEAHNIDVNQAARFGVKIAIGISILKEASPRVWRSFCRKFLELRDPHGLRVFELIVGSTLKGEKSDN